MMRVEPARVGARGCDSLRFSQSGSRFDADALKSAGVEFFVGYLGSMTADRVEAVLQSGMAFMPVTFADQFDGSLAASRCRALGLPLGVTVWLDLESAPHATADELNAWAQAMRMVGYDPGLYVGANQPFDAEDLYALGFDRYWRAPGMIPDPSGCGYCMYQLYPTVECAGIQVDYDFIQQDWKGRLPNWVVNS